MNTCSIVAGALRALIWPFAAMACLGYPTDAAALEYADPWSPATESAAESSVARMGAQRARAIRAEIRTIQGLAPRELKASVIGLEAAKRDLGARESAVEIRIDLPADILFDVDKALIRDDAAQALAHLATVIRAYSGPVRLLGHTDSDGSDAHNLDLSRRRAESVQSWLIKREEISASRLSVEAYGESRPMVDNDTPQNKQKNRRVEVVVRKSR